MVVILWKDTKIYIINYTNDEEFRLLRYRIIYVLSTASRIIIETIGRKVIKDLKEEIKKRRIIKKKKIKIIRAVEIETKPSKSRS